MLNSAQLNGFQLNGSGSAQVFILSTANLSSGASSFTGDPTLTGALRASVNGGMHAVFSGYSDIFAHADLFGEFLLSSEETTIKAGYASLHVSSSIVAYVIREVPAEGGFDTFSSFEGLPDSLLGSADLIVDSEFTGEQTLSHFTGGNYTGSTLFEEDGAFIIAGATSNVSIYSHWFSEGTLESGGVIYHDASSHLVAKFDFENAQHLTATFIIGAFGTITALFDAVPTHIHKAGQHLIGTAQVTPLASVVQYGDVNINAEASINFTPTHTHNIVLDLTHTSMFSGKAISFRVGHANLIGKGTINVIPTRIAGARSSLTASGTITANGVRVRLAKAKAYGFGNVTSTGTIIKLANADLIVTGITFTAGGVLRFVSAPAHRVYIVPYTKRDFKVSGTIRKFEVVA